MDMWPFLPVAQTKMEWSKSQNTPKGGKYKSSAKRCGQQRCSNQEISNCFRIRQLPPCQTPRLLRPIPIDSAPHPDCGLSMVACVSRVPSHEQLHLWRSFCRGALP